MLPYRLIPYHQYFWNSRNLITSLHVFFAFTVSNDNADTTLNQFLRQNLGLTGTKVLCREGGCGVCVVYVEKPDPANPEITVKGSINSV